MGEGRFRADLFHRLAAVQVEMPPLRERREDLVPLAEVVVAEADRDVSADLKDALTRFLDEEARDYAWPGNVRELQTAVRSLALGVPPRLAGRKEGPLTGDVPGELAEGAWTLEAAKRWYARHVHARSPSARAAARRLGVHRGTLARYLEEDDGGGAA